MDITYEDLIKARKTDQSPSGDFDIMKMADVALRILEQVSVIKGGGAVQTSRPPAEQTPNQQVTPAIDIGQIKKALQVIKSTKGDIKISELESLIDENKETLQRVMGGL
ncbi:MAG: hypothetical protein OCU12_07985 [Methanophagales archaeon]|nr:hypothetical protein [Methanophagales archaeon]